MNEFLCTWSEKEKEKSDVELSMEGSSTDGIESEQKKKRENGYEH